MLLGQCRAAGWDVQGIVADVSLAEDRQLLLDAVSEAFQGKLNVLFNNVGTNIRHATVDFTQVSSVRGGGSSGSGLGAARMWPPGLGHPQCACLSRAPAAWPAGGVPAPDQRQPGVGICALPASPPAAEGRRRRDRHFQQQRGGWAHSHGLRLHLRPHKGGTCGCRSCALRSYLSGGQHGCRTCVAAPAQPATGAACRGSDDWALCLHRCSPIVQAALNQLAKNLTCEWAAKDNIRAVSVAPW